MTRALLLLLSLLILAPPGATAQERPEPRPDASIFFYNADLMYSPEEMRTLLRDADLLQRTGIPTVVYVREVSAAEAAPERSQGFANTIRDDWNVASEAGADDGLVLLMSWVPEEPSASTVVMSYGEATFGDNGLSAASIQQTIDTSVASLFEQGHPFEAAVYLMRETRYDGIYSPPAPAPVEGMRKVAHSALAVAGPIIAVIAVIALAGITLRAQRQPLTDRELWKFAGLLLAGAALFWLLAVYSKSEIGVVSSLVTMALLAVAAWIWTRPSFRPPRNGETRTLRVPKRQIPIHARHAARTAAPQAGGTR